MAKLKAVQPEPEHPPAPDMRTAVEQAVAAMPWLVDSDMALVALALNYAERIEAAAALSAELDAAWADARGDASIVKRLQKLEASADATKMLGWLGQQLQGVLAQLGGTPTARKAMQEKSPAGGRLAELRRAAGRATAGQGAGQHAAPEVDPSAD